MIDQNTSTQWTSQQSNTRKQLRNLISGTHLTLVPGVSDAFVAKLAKRAGFKAILATGAGIANTLLGEPDVGITTMTEVVSVTRRIVEAVDIPVIADADTGYGNHINVARTIREFEHAGVAGLFIEDQEAPKRCGHFDKKRLVPTSEMVEKLTAAVRARQDRDLVLIARTDAIAVEGFEAAIERANAYIAAGAEVIFVEAPTSREQMEEIPKRIKVPNVVNLVEGGITPLLPAAELEELGFRIAFHANLALRVAGLSIERAFKSLLQEGTSKHLIPDMLSWEQRQEIVGLPHWDKWDADILQESETIHAALTDADSSRSEG